jgi:hypothetical protein
MNDLVQKTITDLAIPQTAIVTDIEALKAELAKTYKVGDNQNFAAATVVRGTMPVGPREQFDLYRNTEFHAIVVKLVNGGDAVATEENTNPRRLTKVRVGGKVIDMWIPESKLIPEGSDRWSPTAAGNIGVYEHPAGAPKPLFLPPLDGKRALVEVPDFYLIPHASAFNATSTAMSDDEWETYRSDEKRAAVSEIREKGRSAKVILAKAAAEAEVKRYTQVAEEVTQFGVADATEDELAAVYAEFNITRRAKKTA